LVRRGLFIESGTASSGNYGHAGRQGERGGSAPSDAASKSIQLSKKWGGATVALTGNVPKSGYAVASVGHELQIGEHPTHAQVVKYISDNKRALQGKYLGSWLHDGKMFLDVTTVHTDRIKALTLGYNRKQIAIFDLGSQKEINVMSDGLRPGESKGTRVRETRSTKQPDTRTKVLIVGNDLTPEQQADAVMDHFARLTGTP